MDPDVPGYARSIVGDLVVIGLPAWQVEANRFLQVLDPVDEVLAFLMILQPSVLYEAPYCPIDSVSIEVGLDNSRPGRQFLGGRGLFFLGCRCPCASWKQEYSHYDCRDMVKERTHSPSCSSAGVPGCRAKSRSSDFCTDGPGSSCLQ